MEPKKYRAKTIQAAVNLVKEEMGPDAMILSTKRLPKSVRNPYASGQFEVTAVSPEDFKKKNVKKDHWVKDIFKTTDTTCIETTENRNSCETGENLDVLKAELSTIRDMVCLYSRGENFSGLLQTHPEYLNMYGLLIKSGLSDVRARAFIEKVDFMFGTDNSNGNPGSLQENLTRLVLNEIHSSIKVVNPFEAPKGERRLNAFIGPTGVGKTTTIAKVAADLHLKQKKNIGLISIDNYRVGALEQLKTYASIMGVPCIPAFSRVDFQAAIKKLHSREIILIDTAGHSHFNEDRMNELMLFIKGNFEISSHLVLSATTDPFNMKDAVNSFSVLKPESFIFTKLDETRRRGGVIDQAMDMNLPISFLTNGQKVPDDIIWATRRRILKMVFGTSAKPKMSAGKKNVSKNISDKIFSKGKASFSENHVR